MITAVRCVLPSLTICLPWRKTKALSPPNSGVTTDVMIFSPVVTGDDNGSWTCNTATSTENINGVMFSADWNGFIHSDYAYDAPLDDAEKLEICYREYLFDEEFPAAVAEFLR